ncbi:hypothetical protein FPV67DRAFT_1455548 [Lyophyllum atratum]|nr:hypothetical protein FPV67DRAFT_1455548 [Lyophyllum atratum]
MCARTTDFEGDSSVIKDLKEQWLEQTRLKVLAERHTNRLREELVTVKIRLIEAMEERDTAKRERDYVTVELKDARKGVEELYDERWLTSAKHRQLMDRIEGKLPKAWDTLASERLELAWYRGALTTGQQESAQWMNRAIRTRDKLRDVEEQHSGLVDAIRRVLEMDTTHTRQQLEDAHSQLTDKEMQEQFEAEEENERPDTLSSQQLEIGRYHNSLAANQQDLVQWRNRAIRTKIRLWALEQQHWRHVDGVRRALEQDPTHIRQLIADPKSHPWPVNPNNPPLARQPQQSYILHPRWPHADRPDIRENVGTQGGRPERGHEVERN